MTDPTPKTQIDISRLRTLLSYDAETGVFRWRVARPNAPVGSVAGCIGNKGYVKIRMDGRYWLAHRLAWAYVHGELPAMLDHKNRLRADNRIANLRPATPSLNSQNTARLAARPLQAAGTTYIARIGKWQAQITTARRTRYLGLYPTQAEANAAYCRAVQEQAA